MITAGDPILFCYIFPIESVDQAEIPYKFITARDSDKDAVM